MLLRISLFKELSICILASLDSAGVTKEACELDVAVDDILFTSCLCSDTILFLQSDKFYAISSMYLGICLRIARENSRSICDFDP